MSHARRASGSLLIAVLWAGCGGEDPSHTPTSSAAQAETTAPAPTRNETPADEAPPETETPRPSAAPASAEPPAQPTTPEADEAGDASPPPEPSSTPSPAPTPQPEGSAPGSSPPETEASPAPTETETEPSPPPAEPEPERNTPVTYTLSPARSWLAVLVWNDPNTVGAGAGHDHAIVASTFTGEVRWSPGAATACSVDISVPVSGLRADPDGARERAKLSADGAVSEKSERTIEKNLRGQDQLWADKFSTIRFRSTACTPTDTGVNVTGDLTIRGVTQSVSVPMTVTFPSDDFRARGRLEISHSMFGFEPFSAAFGALRNQDRLSLRVDVRGSSQ